jgi:hypothetical protein
MKNWVVHIKTDNTKCLYLDDTVVGKFCKYSNRKEKRCEYEECPLKYSL